jgi:phosphopantothenoylcysteine decarboxylase/phosphopantothenate--cysteine ligase
MELGWVKMKLLVTAGPTREPIDPVRFISNRSSGKMGYAVARAGARLGHEVRLISGPVSIEPPAGVACERVTTAEEMLEAVRRHVPWCEALVMAAAPADWRPAVTSPRKLKKERMAGTLPLCPTPDILKTIAPLKGGRLFVGFAAETEDVESRAALKRADKGLDLIVANDVSRSDAGFEVDTNQATLIDASGGREALPLMAKDELGARIVAWLAARLTLGIPV